MTEINKSLNASKFEDNRNRRRRRLHYEDLQVLFPWYIDLLPNDHDHEGDSTKLNKQISKTKINEKKEIVVLISYEGCEKHAEDFQTIF